MIKWAGPPAYSNATIIIIVTSLPSSRSEVRGKKIFLEVCPTDSKKIVHKTLEISLWNCHVFWLSSWNFTSFFSIVMDPWKLVVELCFFSEILFTFSSPFQSALLVLSSCVILVFLTSKIFANQKGACLSTQQTTSEFPLKIKGVWGISPTVDTSFLKLLVLC